MYNVHLFIDLPRLIIYSYFCVSLHSFFLPGKWKVFVLFQWNLWSGAKARALTWARYFVHLNENTSFDQCDDSSSMVQCIQMSSFFTRSIQNYCEPDHFLCIFYGFEQAMMTQRKGDENEKREKNRIKSTRQRINDSFIHSTARAHAYACVFIHFNWVPLPSFWYRVLTSFLLSKTVFIRLLSKVNFNAMMLLCSMHTIEWKRVQGPRSFLLSTKRGSITQSGWPI